MVDYSKWKKIEVSDDEDETHPNIDTPSLFKWRHEARIEREADFKKRTQNCNDRLRIAEKELNQAKKACEGLTGKELDAAKKAMLKVEKKYKACLEDKNKLEREKRLQPLNVDSLSKDGFQRTYLNKPKPKNTDLDHLSDDEKERLQKEFFKNHEKEIKQYGMLRKFDDSRRFLQDRPHLVCDWTNNYLIIWCLNLEMEDKSELSAHVAHQSTCMNYILELGKQLEVDPRSCVSTFFNRIQAADKMYKDMFESELNALIERVKKRAQDKLEIAMREAEEEERVKRLGPGGLDPVEVFQTLPEEMQKCFDARDLDMLKEVVAKMDTADARYHMERCIASGLWVADASEAAAKGDDEDDGASTSAGPAAATAGSAPASVKNDEGGKGDRKTTSPVKKSDAVEKPAPSSCASSTSPPSSSSSPAKDAKEKSSSAGTDTAAAAAAEVASK